MKKIILPLITAFIILTLFACEKVFDINEENTKTMKYNELPNEIRLLLDSNIETIDKSNFDFYFSIDSTIEFTYGRSGSSDNWFNEINSNYHHFFIDGVHYRLKGNKGSPFILYKGYIYYCDLNLSRKNYMLKYFFSVKVPKIR